MYQVITLEGVLKLNEMTTTQATSKSYKLVYKCFLCGSVLYWAETVQLNSDMLTEFLSKFVHHQQFAGNPYLHQVPGHLVCMCKDGSTGLAYFAGVKKA